VESDLQNPINVYGTSKLAGEHLVRQAAPRWLIVRVSSLFGKTGAVERVAILSRRFSPRRKEVKRFGSSRYQYFTDLCARCGRSPVPSVGKRCDGGRARSNGGSCTWYEFAKTALALCDLPPLIEPVATSAFPTRARRPRIQLSQVRNGFATSTR